MPLVIPAMARFQESILFTPSRPGDFEFTLSIPVERDEAFDDNNAQSFRMSLRREVLHVLVVESRPRWEFRFLRNALSRDPGVDVHCLLLHPRLGRGEGDTCIPAFPDTRDAISGYDVVFLGDVGVGPNGLTTEQAELLTGLVEQQGSGLVFMPGLMGNQATFRGTPLNALMPVVLDEQQPKGVGFRLPTPLDLTARGRDHLLTMLASSPEENAAVWRQLPGFYWHAPVVKAKPGCDVLAVHATARNRHGRLPLLVTAHRGNGKVLFLGTDGAWRWRRGVEDVYHYRFWGQVVRWMAHQRHMAHREGMRLFYSPEAPRRGETVFLHATVFDTSGFPLQEGTVRAAIMSEAGDSQVLRLESEAGGWGVFTGSFVPRERGAYKVVLTWDEGPRRVQTQIGVTSPRRERVGRPARAGVLREIAAVTRGRCGTVGDLEAMVRNLTLLPERAPVETRFCLWCHPLWAALVVTVLAVYWMGRKLAGLR